MSLNSLITDKLYGKRAEVQQKQRTRLEEEFKVMDKAREGDRKAYEEKLEKLLSEARTADVTLNTARSWDGNRYVLRPTAVIDHDSPTYTKKREEFNKIDKKELDVFEALSERAQLCALLPAKERRDEMTAILAEIKKFA